MFKSLVRGLLMYDINHEAKHVLSFSDSVPLNFVIESNFKLWPLYFKL